MRYIPPRTDCCHFIQVARKHSQETVTTQWLRDGEKCSVVVSVCSSSPRRQPQEIAKHGGVSPHRIESRYPAAMAETDLYLPVKRHLMAQGYEVKSEVQSCDVVGLRGDELPVIVELKQSLSLALLYQAVDRLTVTDHVYVAIARPKRGITSSALKLCRRLGLGLIVVATSGSLEVLADPLPYQPRPNLKKRGRLLKEFNARSGDPNIGGSTRKPLMTAYRQDAIKCATHLSLNGPARIRDVKAATKVDRAATIFRGNVYGWFQKRERGVYELAEAGRQALSDYAPSLR